MGAATLSGPDFVWLIGSLCQIKSCAIRSRAGPTAHSRFALESPNVTEPCRRSAFVLVRAVSPRLRSHTSHCSEVNPHEQLSSLNQMRAIVYRSPASKRTACWMRSSRQPYAMQMRVIDVGHT